MFLSFFALTMGACSNELPMEQTAVDGNSQPQKVSITISGENRGARTRTAPEASERENALDESKMFAVVFDSEGANGKVYQLTSGAETWDFNIDDRGTYKMYLVANTSVLTDGETFADVATLFGTIDNGQDPGDSEETSTHFLMTSGEIALNVSGTTLATATATLRRAVARVDVTSYAGFQITSIEVTNRYLGTVISRTDMESAITMEAGLTQDPENENFENARTKVYTIANQQNAEALIYTYENLSSAAANQLKIKVNGVDTNDGNQTKSVETTLASVQRNKAYKLAISATSAADFDKLTATLSISDWAPFAKELHYTNLTDNDTPNFSVVTADAAMDNVVGGTVSDANTENPTEIWVMPTASANKTLTLTVIGNKVGSAVTATAASTTAGAPAATTAATTNDGSGHIQQTFTLEFTPAMAGKIFTYKVYNQIAGDVSNQTFRVVVKPDYSQIAVGDIIYADGTFTAAYDADHATSHGDPIAIVFRKSTTSYDGSKAQNGIGNFTHGYAMALKRANGGENVANWATGTYATTQVTDVMYDSGTESTQWTNITGDMDGLKHCKTAYATNGNSYTGLTAIKAACEDFEGIVSAPQGTSGWYLPSIGQMYQWCVGLGSAATTGWTFRPDATCHDFYLASQAYNVATAINAKFTGMTQGTHYDQFSKTTNDNTTYDYLWSSTERSAGYPFHLNFSTNGNLYLYGNDDKSYTGKQVRAVLAF